MDRIRNGNFTSSQIYNLMGRDKSGKGFGVNALTYIEEKNMERRLGRAIESERDSRVMTWGSLCERQTFELLGTEYRLASQETVRHPEIESWCGSPDANKFKDGKKESVAEIKCPQLKVFCKVVDAWRDGGIDAFRKAAVGYRKVGEEWYWQIVSNAILEGVDFAELIVYCPYQSELDSIRELAAHWDGPDQKRFEWIQWASDEELAFLPDGGYYRNLNVFRFEVPFLDKQILTERVIEASKFLVEPKPINNAVTI